MDRDDIANGFSGKPNPAWDSLDPARQKDLARRMALFAAMVEHVDRGVGRIVDHLKQTGDFDNTIILILSDNGACYEWGPYGFDNVSRRGITHLHTGDVMPTLRTAAGADYPKTFAGNKIQPEEGMSLLHIFNGESLPERPIYFEHQETRALIRGNWKLVWGKRMPWQIEWELYNLGKDRCETIDLADKHPERIRRMADEWLVCAKRVKLYPFYLSE